MNADYQERERHAVDALKKQIPRSLKKNKVKGTEGLFAEIFESDLFPEHYCVCAADTAGTKVLIAQAMEKYDTIGIDVVAMNANDLATLGRISPFLFLNCMSVQSVIQEKGITAELMKGIVKGLEQSNASDVLHNTVYCNLGKGETASVHELLGGIKPGHGFDIAGTMIGFIEKKSLVLTPHDGDVIIALASSGVHSNGFTDLRLKLLQGDFETRAEYRKGYQGKYRLHDLVPGTSITVGDALLEPTMIYVRIMATLGSRYRIVGVNNTGYGLRNFNRITGFDYLITEPLEPQPIFSLMQHASGFSDYEMYQRFNMGMGFFVIANPHDVEGILSLCTSQQCPAKLVGKVRKSNHPQTVLRSHGKELVYEGY
ncbi:hypothetical protein HYW21_08980 [Candidatus Woesearchaeota archaeon]|nr:hypothetical protein [Candidatus Woesearchaeota archaeon]